MPQVQAQDALRFEDNTRTQNVLIQRTYRSKLKTHRLMGTVCITTLGAPFSLHPSESHRAAHKCQTIALLLLLSTRNLLVTMGTPQHSPSLTPSPNDSIRAITGNIINHLGHLSAPVRSCQSQYITDYSAAQMQRHWNPLALVPFHVLTKACHKGYKNWYQKVAIAVQQVRFGLRIEQ